MQKSGCHVLRRLPPILIDIILSRLGTARYISRHPRHGPPVSYCTVAPIIYVIRICGLYSNVYMLVSIDVVFYGPQILIPYLPPL
jgi:hypothetical protein